MNESNRTGPVIAFVVVVLLFLIFGFGMMSGWNLGGWMGGSPMMGSGSALEGGYGWMWIPTLITLCVGIMLGWMIFGKRR